jgi:serine protease Do
MAKSVMDDLVSYGRVRRGWLGVYLQPLTEDFAKAYGIKTDKGAVVADVVSGSPADKAGIKRGDVITSVDGAEIKDPQDLVFQIRKRMAGDKVNLEVVSQSGSRSVAVTLGEIPGQSEEPRTRRTSLEESLGVEVSPVTPALKEEFGLSDQKGLVVTRVKPGSPADHVGLQKGDVILEANGSAADSVEDLERASQGADVVVLLMWRDGRTFFVSLRP